MIEITTDYIKQALTGDLSFLHELLPQAMRRGDEFICGNVYGDKGSSFAYNCRTGKWSDFATGETGGSILDLIMAQKNYTIKEACDYCRERLGNPKMLEPIKQEPPKKEKPKELSIFPDGQYPQFIYKDGKSYRFSRMWAYKDKDGNIYAYDCRVDYPDGSKDVIPFRWNAKENHVYQAMLPVPRMLCGIEDLDDCKGVIIVEGCKTREATKYYFRNWCVLTWQGGCEAVSKSDWSVIKDKNVIIIPDADAKKDKLGKTIDWKKQHGFKASEEIAHKLYKHNKVRIVNTQKMGELKDGWDIADAFESGMPQSELVDFVKQNIYTYIDEVEKEQNDDDINVVVEKKEKKDKNTLEYDDSYFRCLGERGSSTFFFKFVSGQVLEFTPSKYDNKHLVSLAPLSYWEAYFGSDNGVNWLQACDFFSRVQEKVGYFNALNIRGRGCWFDEDRIVLHLGRSLIVDGNPVMLRSFRTKNIYEQRDGININIDNPLPAVASKKFIDVCKMARWEDDYYGEMLAGWIFSAVVCGAMKFRSHLYLIGQSGSGKSWLQDHIIKPIMGKMCAHVSSKTTEAGIRAMLNNDILPVVCDENEKEDSKKDAETLQAIFDLARNASSEQSEPIIKSSPTGQIKVYYCRSAFLFSSIKTSMEKVADLNRTAFIRLQGKPQDCTEAEKMADTMKFEKLRDSAEKLITPEYCESMLARAVKLASVMRESQQIVSDVSAKIYGDRRQGDQMGMIIAGLQGLKSDLPITETEAEMYLDVFTKNKERIYSAEDEKQEQNCLDTLLRMPVKVGTQSYPLSRCISFILGCETPENNFISVAEITNTLAYGGIKLIGTDFLALSTKTTAEHCVYFQNTMFGVKGWIDELSRISRKSYFDTIKYTPISKARSFLIPLSEVIK